MSAPLEMKSALEHITGLISVIFNLFTLGQLWLGGYSSYYAEKESDPVYVCSPRYFQVTLYWRILTSQMDVMAVFCIICSPIHVMLCKSKLKVDGCNLRGSLAYVYLRSSFVHSEDKAQSREPVAVSSSSGADSQALLSPDHSTSRPWFPSQGRHCCLVIGLTRAWMCLGGCWHHRLPKSEWIRVLISKSFLFFFLKMKIEICKSSPDMYL